MKAQTSSAANIPASSARRRETTLPRIFEEFQARRDSGASIFM
jgi:hypothetical protein